MSSATQHPHIDGTHTSSLKSFADIVDEFNAGTLAGTTPVEGAQFGIGFGGTGNGRKTVEELVNSKLEPYLGCGFAGAALNQNRKLFLLELILMEQGTTLNLREPTYYPSGVQHIFRPHLLGRYHLRYTINQS